MNLLQMSLSGAVMIAAVIVVRALTINRLPKTTFLILWGIVLFRLLVPFSVPSAFSVYSLMGQIADWNAPEQISAEPVGTVGTSGSPEIQGSSQPPEDIGSAAYNDGQQTSYINFAKTDGADIMHSTMYHTASLGWETSGWPIIWFVGMIACTVYFAVSYLRCRFEFRISLPVENTFAQLCLRNDPRCRLSSGQPVKNSLAGKWLEKFTRRREISVRQSDRVTTPLTYGVFHPVILMPKSTDWGNREQLRYVFLHEYVHICRYDALTKLVVVSALCIHWFNPLVWIMYILFNRDVEISCDESVVRRMGEASKSTYAMMLIQMEAARSSPAPLCNGLLYKIGRNAMEERITSIMKIRKKSKLAGIAAAVLIVGVASAFATSAAKTTEAAETDMDKRVTEELNDAVWMQNADFTGQEYEMLLALRLDGYEDMSISEFQDKIQTLTDTEEYSSLLERFFANETLYAKYENRKGTDNNDMLTYMYNVLAPLMVDEQPPPIGFGGNAVSDFPGASDNASVEYYVTLTVLDTDSLTVYEYDWARQSVMDDLSNILKNLTTTDLRDEEWMKVYIDEAVENFIRMYGNNFLQITIEYNYTPLGVMAVDDMEDWQKTRRDEWDRMMAPYVPFGLTYRYDWDTDDYKMYYQGKEVRGIYDDGEHIYISEHIGTGEDIYDENAIELIAVYKDGKLAGLREATEQEMMESFERRRVIIDSNEVEVREYLPATQEDYDSLFALKTSGYRSKSIADFDQELLDWANADYDRIERVGCDRSWNDYHVALTDEEKSFVALTTWLSELENAEYVRSLWKNEPERDICADISLPAREEMTENNSASAWSSLSYRFSYHIADKNKVNVGKRDDRIGKMISEIQSYWESADINQLVKMTERDMLELLRAKAKKYSSQDIVITISDDWISFESMDERDLAFLP